MPIIQSLLDTDLYKFTMMQAVLHQFPGAMVEYVFYCRDEKFNIAPFANEIAAEIKALCSLRFQQEELDYLRQFSFFKSDFIEFLRIFSLHEDFINLEVLDGKFSLTIQGPWLHTILFEVPILAIISEVYFRNHYPEPDLVTGRKRLAEKIAFVQSQQDLAQHFHFSDFGTRRRFSHAWQDEVVATLKTQLPLQLNGTSNVYFAKQHGLKPIGTMAHEYLQACQSLGPRLIYSQKFAFEKWAQEYRGELGIALSDVFGTPAFLRDFDLYFCKLFDGARHDSGDPFDWAEKIIAHYKENKIDPRTKTLVFSDNLDFQTALKLCQSYHQKANPVFGIGTHLTNDLGYHAMPNVIKMIRCNGQAVAKISDNPEKTICPDRSYLAYLKQVFHIEEA